MNKNKKIKIIVLLLLSLFGIGTTIILTQTDLINFGNFSSKSDGEKQVNNQVTIKARNSTTSIETTLPDFTTEFISMTDVDSVCPFTIVSNSTLSQVIIFQEKYTKLIMGAAFVKVGESVSFKLPPSDYRIKYIAGEIWENDVHFFGKGTKFFENTNDITNVTSFDGCPEQIITVSDNSKDIHPIKTLDFDLPIEASRKKVNTASDNSTLELDTNSTVSTGENNSSIEVNSSIENIGANILNIKEIDANLTANENETEMITGIPMDGPVNPEQTSNGNESL